MWAYEQQEGTPSSSLRASAEETKLTENYTIPLSIQKSMLFWKAENLLPLFKTAYLKLGFQVLRGIWSFPVHLLFSGSRV